MNEGGRCRCAHDTQHPSTRSRFTASLATQATPNDLPNRTPHAGTPERRALAHRAIVAVRRSLDTNDAAESGLGRQLGRVVD
jgi:hypothetical protein